MKRSMALVVFAFLLISLFSVPSTPSHAQEKVYKFRYADMVPPSHTRARVTEAWIKEIEKRSNDRIKISYFPSNTLTPPAQTYDSITKGIADMGSSVLGYSAGRFPLSEVLTLPLGFKDGKQATHLADAYYKKFQPKEFSDTKTLMLYGGASCMFMTVKPLTKTEDLKGMRIRVLSECADIAKAVGASPVTMPVTEAYDGLQKGLMDGILISVETLKSYRFGELIKTVLDNPAFSYAVSFFVSMNKQKWESLPKDLQKVIESVNDDFVGRYADNWFEGEKDGLEYGISKGAKVVKVPPDEQARWSEKMKPMHDEYVKMAKSKGLPGEEALKFCLDYIKQHP
jgi:TRAP-type transport system periplasmic protein